MFISKKDLENLETKLRHEYKEYFDGKIVEINEKLLNLSDKSPVGTRQKTKKVVD